MSTTRSPPQFENLARLDAHIETTDLLPVARLLAYLTDDVTLQFTDAGLRVKTLSDTSVIGFDATVPVEYGTDTEPVTFGVDTDQFLSAVSFISDPDSIKLQIRTDDPEITVSTGSRLNYVDALEPDDPETISPHPEVEYATTAAVDAHELKRAVATVFGSGDGAVFVTLTDDTLWATVPGVEAVGTASLAKTEGRHTYTRLSDELFGGILQRVHPDETLTVSTREEFPFHIEAEHYTVTIVPQQFPEDEYDPLADVEDSA
ncbi:hypothetical protein [Halorubrum aethiopicum]|uniref:hypothetical protein n=1 Tax=Halorubrum aethiopicum TaxID=1758255 RepID=UPI00082EFA70|nr:hypothetical protein [Halorubrum aethiopicum]